MGKEDIQTYNVADALSAAKNNIVEINFSISGQKRKRQECSETLQELSDA